MNPKIDIMIPHYGDTASLRVAIDSVLVQKYQNWRMVIVDDGGSNETEDLVRQIALSTQNQVKYIKNPTNLGFAKNFQRCLDLVESDWFVMMGNDDKMMPNFLEQFAKLKNEDFDFYQPAVIEIDDSGKPVKTRAFKMKKRLSPKAEGIYSGEKLAASLMVGNWLYFPSIIWRSAAAQKYGFQNQFGDLVDMRLELDIILGGGKLYFDKSQPSFCYRRHKNSASSVNARNGQHRNDEKLFYAWCKQQFQQKGWKKAKLQAQIQITSRIKRLIDLLFR